MNPSNPICRKTDGLFCGQNRKTMVFLKQVFKVMNERRFNLEQICNQFGVLVLYAFGSQSKRVKEWLEGHQNRLPLDSDVDIGVRMIPGAKWSIVAKVSLALALEDLFCCKRVDLVSLLDADPFLAAEIIRGERIFASDEHGADEYELYVLRRGGDLAQLERERMALVLGETT